MKESEIKNKTNNVESISQTWDYFEKVSALITGYKEIK